MTTLSARLMATLQTDHFATADLPGVGGEFKQSPEDFCVEEIMPYDPCGEGEHVYMRLKRMGMTTPELAKVLAKTFNYPLRDIGWAGLKDKVAVTTQTFSLRLGWHSDLGDIQEKLAGIDGIEVLAVNKHKNKIKRGHVRENRFKITIRETGGDAIEAATAIASRIESTGVPNYFGEQRFGRNFSNISSACRVFSEQRVKSRQDTFMISVLQAALFNIWLRCRQESGDLLRLVAGDIAQKTDTGGLFDVIDSAVEQHRYDSKEIIYTGPIFGYSMREAGGEEGEREQRILTDFGLTESEFKPVKAPGTRRAGVIYPTDLTVGLVGDDIQLSFGLPSGAYATQVLREFMKA